ncbi:MAG TPA: SWIM zinc finger family protein [Chloroflexota bacterium]|nr:SWIM zinc finger family protein [Chloroflexota bacterium]
MARAGRSYGTRYEPEPWWREYERAPRRPANGIKAQTQRGQFGKTWWASRWISALERLVDAGRLGRGRSYARSGQVLTLDVGPDGVAAKVQGSRPTPYTVSIRFRRLSDEAWEQVADALAGEARYAARLLSGEMPQDIEQAFTAAGASLFPAARQDLETECSCPDWSNPCKHVAAVYYLLGERFDADPFLLFVLRGRDQQWMTEALRARRAGAAPPPAAEPEATAEVAPAAAPAPALADLLDTYWTAAALPAIAFEPAELDALAVKRLGPAPFAADAGEFERRLEADYRAISAHAYGLALGEDVI